MTFNARRPNPQTIARLGALCLLLGILLSRLVHPSAALGEGAIDGASGVLLGLSIGFNLWAARRGAFRRCRAGEAGGREA